MERIKRLREQLKYDYRLLKSFGLKIACIDFILAVPLRRGRGKIGKKVFLAKHENIKKFLKHKFSYFLESYKIDEKHVEPLIQTNIIWIFWWQGIENAPLIVKKCIDSIKKNNPMYNVIILTKDNIKKYANIPDNIYDMLESGKITVTTFSDVLRFDLLYNQGGVWCDATLYCTGKFPDYSQYSFYTIKHGLYSDYHVCKGMWSGFFLVAEKGNLFCKFVRDFFLEYYRKYDTTICYLLIDCFMAIGYELFDTIKKEVDIIPFNNSMIFEMQEMMNCLIEDKEFESICASGNLHKLRWKGKMVETIKNKKTVIGRIINE